MPQPMEPRHSSSFVLYGCIGRCDGGFRVLPQRALQEIKLGWGDSLTYNTGFAVTAHLSGRCPCPDRADKSECVYFADAVTEKKIAIFSLTGLLLQTVPLGEVLNNLHQIDGITVLHPDTIVINGKYNNRVAIIDRTGRCSVLADLSEHMRRPDGLTYELWTSNFGPFVLEKHLCFHVSLVANSIGGYCGQDAPRVNETYRYEWLDRNGPHFASLSLDSITDGPRLIWGPTESDKDTIQNIALVHRLEILCMRQWAMVRFLDQQPRHPHS